MPDTLQILAAARSNTSVGRWPYLGNLLPTPMAETRFDDPDLSRRLEGGVMVTVYAGACEGLRRLAAPGAWSASKVGVTSIDLRARLRYMAADRYGSHYRRADGSLAEDHGWAEWMAQPLTVSLALSPSSPVEPTPRGLRVRLPATLTVRAFDRLLSDALDVVSINRVMASPAGVARVGLLGLDPARYDRVTEYSFPGSSRISRARELCWFRPRLDTDALVVVIEALLAAHLVQTADGEASGRAVA